MRSTVEFDDFSRLQETIKRLPGVAEKTINQILHVNGVEIATSEMTGLLPVSKKNKKHAKDSAWSANEQFNLGFKVKSAGGAANKKGSFGYLVFPDEGRGPSNPWEQRFSNRSLVRATPKILDALEINLTNRIEEEL